MQSFLSSLLRQPLLHFLLLGALLLGVNHVLSPIEPITVTNADIERLRQEWVNQTQRPPTSPEFSAVLRRWLNEEILLREALRLNLDRVDSVTRQRLLMNLRFADPDTQLDDETLLREARALGMTTRDMVARQRLIDLMSQHLSSGVTLSDAEVRDYVSKHPDRYSAEARYSLRQFFFSRDLRHDAAHTDAQRCAQRLRTQPEGNCAADAFLLGSHLRGQSPEDLARAFGKPVSDGIASLAPQRWSAPIESAYGWHLFRVESLQPAADQDYAQVRQRAAYALLAERETQTVDKAVEKLRSRYEVRLPEGTSVTP